MLSWEVYTRNDYRCAQNKIPGKLLPMEAASTKVWPAEGESHSLRNEGSSRDGFFNLVELQPLWIICKGISTFCPPRVS